MMSTTKLGIVIDPDNCGWVRGAVCNNGAPDGTVAPLARVGMITAADLLLKEFPPDRWIINGLLTRQNTAFVIGPAKRCKSWLLMAAEWNLSEGLPIWGQPSLTPPRPLRTVYFAQEDTAANLQDRLKKHVDGGRTTNDRIILVPKDLDMKLDTEAGYMLLRKHLDAAQEEIGAIDLVILDPMRRIFEGDENSSKVMNDLWRVLEVIHRDYDCATLVSHHIAKPPEDKDTYDPHDPYNARGSGDVYGGGDAFVTVEPMRMFKSPESANGEKQIWWDLRLGFETKRFEPILPINVRVDLVSGQVTGRGEFL